MNINILEEQRIMVIIRHMKPFDAVGIFQSILNAGLNIVEITLNTPQALKLIQNTVTSLGKKMLIGAGTVLTLPDLERALDSGARFIVSPIFNREIVESCSKRNIPVFPGALTPSEIYHSYHAGASMVKVFPASLFGPSYLKSIKAPLADLKIMAVGGIRDTNAKDFISSGADAVAIGSGIIKPDWIEAGNFQAIETRLTEFRNALN